MHPRHCSAMVLGAPSDIDGHQESVSCTKRIFKRGICVEHYKDDVANREIRRRKITRHRIGSSRPAVYGTIEEANEPNWCHVISCRRLAVINIDGILYCMKHFQKTQKVMENQ